MQQIHFNHQLDTEFHKVLKQRVNGYFKNNKLSIHANKATYLKIFFWISSYIALYLLIIFTPWTLWIKWILCLLMGFSMAGIGLNISHQGAHESISSKKWVNRLFSLSFNLMGMSDYIWKIKHNVFHHSYTNVYEADEALKEEDILRLSKDATWKPIHRFQHFYTVYTP